MVAERTYGRMESIDFTTITVFTLLNLFKLGHNTLRKYTEGKPNESRGNAFLVDTFRCRRAGRRVIYNTLIKIRLYLTIVPLHALHSAS